MSKAYKKCEYKDGELSPCYWLSFAFRSSADTYYGMCPARHFGLGNMTGAFVKLKFKAEGDKKERWNPMLMHYCPFCGEPISADGLEATHED